MQQEEPEDRRGMTDEQWAIYKRATTGYGDQDENGIDLSLLRENLKLTPTQRLEKLQRAQRFFAEWDHARYNRISQNNFSAEGR